MSYMKMDNAQKWTTWVFCWEQQLENLDQTRFLDLDDFCNDFKKEFTPAHSNALAINHLESVAYYQKGRPLDDYIDEFQDLVLDSSYTDPKTIVVKFCQGLSAQIQNVVATMVWLVSSWKGSTLFQAGHVEVVVDMFWHVKLYL